MGGFLWSGLAQLGWGWTASVIKLVTQPGRLHCLGQCGLSFSRRVAQVASHGGLSSNERPAPSPRHFQASAYISLAKANHVTKFRWKSPLPSGSPCFQILNYFEILNYFNYEPGLGQGILSLTVRSWSGKVWRKVFQGKAVACFCICSLHLALHGELADLGLRTSSSVSRV